MVYYAYLAVPPVRLSCHRTRTVLLSKDWFWIQTFDDHCRASDQVRKKIAFGQGFAACNTPVTSQVTGAQVQCGCSESPCLVVWNHGGSPAHLQ